MHKLFICVLTIASLNAHAEPSPPGSIDQYQFISDSVGALRFVLQNPKNTPYSDEVINAEIQVFSADQRLVQHIPVEVSFASPSFEFIDLNDDGYIDLLFYSSEIPSGSIPLPEAYMYIPKLKKFVKSNTLSDRGAIRKSKSRSCVYITSDSNLFGYTVEEFCFSLETGKWKLKSSKRVDLE
jgi:hypothetical protein